MLKKLNDPRRWIVGLVAVAVGLGLVVALGTNHESGGGSLPGGGSYYYSRTVRNEWASAAAWALLGLVVISVITAAAWALFRRRRQLRQHRWLVGLVGLVLVFGGIATFGVHSSSQSSITAVPVPSTQYTVPSPTQIHQLEQHGSQWSLVLASVLPLLLYGIMISGLVAFVWMFFSYRQHLREHESEGHDHASGM